MSGCVSFVFVVLTVNFIRISIFCVKFDVDKHSTCLIKPKKSYNRLIFLNYLSIKGDFGKTVVIHSRMYMVSTE